MDLNVVENFARFYTIQDIAYIAGMMGRVFVVLATDLFLGTSNRIGDCLPTNLLAFINPKDLIH